MDDRYPYDQVGPVYLGQCGGNILDGPETAAYHTKYPTQVEAVVGPMLSFSVGPHSGACNGEAQNGTADAAWVSLGASDSSVVKKAAQAPNFGSNAGNGFNFYMHSSSSSANQAMADGRGHYIADVPDATSSPATFAGEYSAGITYRAVPSF